MPFSCNICEQESTKICAFCTKDACVNHICVRCGCCSDCCECDVPLEEPAPEHIFANGGKAPAAPVEMPVQTLVPAVAANVSGVEPEIQTASEPASEPFDTPDA